MKIGLGQIKYETGKVKKNLKKIQKFIFKAKKEEVDLLVFPELSLTGYSLKSRLIPKVALKLDGPIIESLKEESKDISLVIGLVEESRNYDFYNTALYLEKGEIKHIHRKIYLPNYGMFEEKKYFISGEEVRSFETSYGRMGMLVCADSWHPVLPYILALDGAFIFINVVSSYSKGLGKKISTRYAWERVNKFYAQVFSCYVVFVNAVGADGENNFWGGSTVIKPGGRILVKPDYSKEQLATAYIDLKRVRYYKNVLPEFKEEKIDLVIRELKRIKKDKLKNVSFKYINKYKKISYLP
ncbi:MAG: nitrilase-related carbon-nitrogen hydrolase [Candidatus Caldatribacteriota bacterium]|nr:nitrilase-related carbon-nitrogen hydrolase [Candidatus Caldatribacteriota bacterium]